MRTMIPIRARRGLLPLATGTTVTAATLTAATLTAAALTAVALIAFASGCSKGGPGNHAVEETDLGWAAWEAEDYTEARTHFLTAVSEDPNYADAHHGLGWAHAFLGSLPQAVTALTNARVKGLTTADPYAGLAIVLRDLPDLDGAIAAANAALDLAPTWSFVHRTSIDWKDLGLVLAQCYYRKGSATFAQAQAQLDLLDPDNGLDPAQPATWTVGEQSYNTYAEALLMAIEAVEADIGG
jgi:tetratricopeptide (TPR) repeat protein